MSTNQAVSEFCIAKCRLLNLEEKYANARKPFVDQVEACKEQIKRYMETHKLTCLPVKIVIAQQPVTRYLRLRKSSAIGALGLEGIQTAVQRVTPDDLKEQFAILKEKLNKPTKKRKKDPVVAPEEKVATITLLDVWDAVIAVKIREEHLKHSESLKLDEVCERQRAAIAAPPEVNQLAQKWHDAHAALEQLSDRKEADSVPLEAVVEQQERMVAKHLQTANAETQSQEVMLTHKGESKPFLLKTKESKVNKPVRITAFKPLVRQSLSDALGPRATTLSNFQDACTDQVKQDLLAHLTHHFVAFQNSQRQIKTYVALDRVGVRSSK